MLAVMVWVYCGIGLELPDIVVIIVLGMDCV